MRISCPWLRSVQAAGATWRELKAGFVYHKTLESTSLVMKVTAPGVWRSSVFNVTLSVCAAQSRRTPMSGPKLSRAKNTAVLVLF